MPLIGEIFISEILNKSVYGQQGEFFGTIKDVVVIKDETLPGIEALLIEDKKKFYRLHYKSLPIFNRKIITTTLQKDQLAIYDFNETDLLAVRDILDKQVVDINGAKVVRVNDIKIEGYLSRAVFVAIDIGVRGILRRLGIEKKTESFLRFIKLSLPVTLISWDYLQPLEPRLKAITLKMPQQMLKQMHPADIAEMINSMPRKEAADFFSTLDVETASETLSELQPKTQVEILSSMETAKAADIIEEMPPDEAADVLPDLPKNKIKEIFDQIDREEAENIQELLGHEEDSAGGIMTNEYLVYRATMTVGEALERFKVDAAEVETIYYIYVEDKDERLAGVLSLKELLLSPPDKYLFDIMITNYKCVHPEDDEDIVAAKISKYNLVAIPVVDDNGYMLGMVTVDDVLDRILPPRAKRKRTRI
ncbi:MAG: CBS domain-containing protein [Candidatus Magnetoovum sp. WYHC-5]|nr:CBS domain-containing protein [Candidatus Magnetoovum sp. WYHC-5]